MAFASVMTSPPSRCLELYRLTSTSACFHRHLPCRWSPPAAGVDQPPCRQFDRAIGHGSDEQFAGSRAMMSEHCSGSPWVLEETPRRFPTPQGQAAFRYGGFHTPIENLLCRGDFRHQPRPGDVPGPDIPTQATAGAKKAHMRDDRSARQAQGLHAFPLNGRDRRAMLELVTVSQSALLPQ